MAALEMYESNNFSFDDVDRSSLKDISSINLNPDQSLEDRIDRLLELVNNPYCFKFKDTPIRVRFSSKYDTLDEALEKHFVRIKNK